MLSSLLDCIAFILLSAAVVLMFLHMHYRIVALEQGCPPMRTSALR